MEMEMEMEMEVEMEMKIKMEIPLHAGFDPISDLVSEEAKAGCERKEISCHLLNLFLFRNLGGL